MHLGLAEWTVLAVIDEGAAHGFAIAALTAREGELGRIWHVPRPVVYRALGRLQEAGLVTPHSAESGAGPQRTPYSVTPTGHSQVLGWLDAPVQHVRELRSQFLIKLALHERRGSDPAELLARQRAALLPIAEAIAVERSSSSGFDDVMLAWRESTTRSALDFLDAIRAKPTQPAR